jgi:hypothetical protein
VVNSLRAGFVRSAAAKGVPEIRIMETTGHKSVAILRGYVRRATVFEGSPLRSILSAAQSIAPMSSMRNRC